MSEPARPNPHSRRGFLRLSGLAIGTFAAASLVSCQSSPAPAATPAAPAAPAPTAPTQAATAAPTQAKPTAAPEPTKAPAAAAQPSGAVVNLKKMAWGSALEKQAIENALKTFMEQNSSIKVEYIHTPDQYEPKLLTMLAGGTAPDVFKVPDSSYPDYVKKGAMMDITEHITGDSVLGKPGYFIEPFEKNRSTVKGKWYAIGSCAQFGVIYFNSQLFEKAGVTPPPTDPGKAWTWEDYVTNATKLTVDQAGKHPGESGFDLGKVAQWGLYHPTGLGTWRYMVFSNGGRDIDPDTLRYVLDKPEAYEAVQAVADLSNKNQVSPKAAALQEMGMNAWQMLSSGRVAMIVDGNWALLDLAKMGFKFGAGVLPKMKKSTTTLNSSLTGEYSKTKYSDQAWQLLRYLNLDDYQIPLVKVGLWGPSHSSLLTPDGIKKWLDPKVHPVGWDQIETDFAMKNGVALAVPVGNQKASAAVIQTLDPVWIGQKPAKDACTEATSKANGILAEEAG